MNYSLINTQSIRDNMYGNTELLKQFVALYLEQTPIDITDIKHAFEIQDQHAIKTTAHHIKPTLKYIGAEHLFQIIDELEIAAQKPNNWETISTLINRALPQLQLMTDELQNFYFSLK